MLPSSSSILYQAIYLRTEIIIHFQQNSNGMFAKKKENRLVTAAVQMMVYDNKTCIIYTYVAHVSRRAKIYITIKSQQYINHQKYQTHGLIYLFVCWSLLFSEDLKLSRDNIIRFRTDKCGVRYSTTVIIRSWRGLIYNTPDYYFVRTAYIHSRYKRPTINNNILFEGEFIKTQILHHRRTRILVYRSSNTASILYYAFLSRDYGNLRGIVKFLK